MRSTVIRVAKGPKTAKMARQRKLLYEVPRTRAAIAAFQAERFNKAWEQALQNSPFYRNWAKQHSLPKKILDIKDLADFPVLTKRDLSDTTAPLLDFEVANFYVSGGSTGEPMKFPMRKNETIARYADRIVTYSWLGLRPGDQYIHLWGHAHLFGQGRKAVVKEQLRKAKDWVVGGYRLNVYNQSSEAIKRWIVAIENRSPKFIVGYASALANLAHAIKDTRGALVVPELKYVISTAETLSNVEKELIESVFGVPVAIEYGAIETGIVAYSCNTLGDRLKLLWGSLAGNVNQNGSIRVSTLDPRAFPLINYALGDQIEGADDRKHLLSFSSIRGRTGDQLSLRMLDGREGKISVIPVVGALKNVTGVRSVQAAQAEGTKAEVYLTGNIQLNLRDMKQVLLRELDKTGVAVDPKSLSVKQLRGPVKSVAGKINLVVPRVES